jgi:hypothetical protein
MNKPGFPRDNLGNLVPLVIDVMERDKVRKCHCLEVPCFVMFV